MRTNLGQMEAHPLDLDAQKLLLEGEMAKEFVNGPIWPVLLDWAEKRCNESLAAIRNNKSSDPLICRELQRKWQSDENWLLAMQVFFRGRIADYEFLRQSLQAIEAGMKQDAPSLGEDTMPASTFNEQGVA